MHSSNLTTNAIIVVALAERVEADVFVLTFTICKYYILVVSRRASTSPGVASPNYNSLLLVGFGLPVLSVQMYRCAACCVKECIV